MIEKQDIQEILSHYALTFEQITNHYDTSHGENDQRHHYILDDKYVLKVNSVNVMWEERLQEISRLIGRYRSIGIYAPALIPTLAETFSYQWKDYICYVEEFAIYPIYREGMDYDRREVVEHLGLLAARYTGVDLSETRSMWSIIDLAPLDGDVDEKQENADALVTALKQSGYTELAEKVKQVNYEIRQQIMTVFDQLPRCVYQGDLNSTNELYHDGHFAGLIDFNLSGTDVNINVFVNETNCFVEEEEIDRTPVEEIIKKMDAEQQKLLDVIWKHYTLNKAEEFALPYYQKITDLFQYPNVCSMVKWLGEEERREKCSQLIEYLFHS